MNLCAGDLDQREYYNFSEWASGWIQSEQREKDMPGNEKGHYLSEKDQGIVVANSPERASAATSS